jgi:anti-anti-sigma factor
MDERSEPYERDGAFVLPLGGEFDVGNTPDLERILGSAPDLGRLLVVDLSKADYIDSSVLAVFIRLKRSRGEHLRLVVPHDSRVRLIFEVAGLLDVLGVAEDLESLFP